MNVQHYVLFAFILAGCASGHKHEIASVASAPMALPKTLEEAVQSEARTAENRARDKYRHPVETLNFFDVKPNMKVVEIWPGSGWYTEILAPFLAGEGHYIAAVNNNSSIPEVSKMNDKMKTWLAAHSDVAKKATLVDFVPPTTLLTMSENSVDRVLTFRNLHNWMKQKGDLVAFQSFYKVLKPGGILGIVEHRGSRKKPQDPEAKSGYVREDYVIALAQKAGFQLVAKSEINANRLDTKNYVDGVWTLPPVLKLGEKDRERYIRIGESDRMTLKFVKPVVATK